MIEFAGQDITHWFDEYTHEPKMAVDAETNMLWYHCPNGRYLHIPPINPRDDWDIEASKTPWWHDETLNIGRLSEKTRKIRIIN